MSSCNFSGALNPKPRALNPKLQIKSLPWACPCSLVVGSGVAVDAARSDFVEVPNMALVLRVQGLGFCALSGARHTWNPLFWCVRTPPVRQCFV